MLRRRFPKAISGAKDTLIKSDKKKKTVRRWIVILLAVADADVPLGPCRLLGGESGETGQ